MAAAVLFAQPLALAGSFTGMGQASTADFTVTQLSNTGEAFGLGGLLQNTTFSQVVSYGVAYSWNAGQYLQLVDTLASGTYGGLTAVSATGTAVGWASAFTGAQAALWGATGPTLLGPPGAFASIATGISANGAVIAGTAQINGLQTPYVASPSAGSASLYAGAPFASPFTPLGLSANGSAILGQSIDFGGGAGAAFGRVSPVGTNTTLSTPIQGLPLTPGSAAVAASDPLFSGSDYAVAVAGYEPIAGQQQAFVLNKDIGGGLNLNRLGVLDGANFSQAAGISADGTVVIGTSGVAGVDSRAFVWTATGGLHDLRTTLTASGADLTGWQLVSATAVSANGRYVAGLGYHNGTQETWVADLTQISFGRTIYAAPGSVLIFDDASSWRDLAGNPVVPAPGKDDDYVLSTGAAPLQVSVLLGTQSAAHSLAFDTGIFTLGGALNSSLTVAETITVKYGVLIPGFGTISAKSLIATGYAPTNPSDPGKGLLTLGDRLRNTGPSVTLQSAEIKQDGRVKHFQSASLQIAHTLTVHGEYESVARTFNLDPYATLEAGRIEVLANCNAQQVCAAPGRFVAGGRVFAESILNAGEFVAHGDGVIVGAGARAGTPWVDSVDAFKNVGTLSVYAGTPWAGNVSNEKGGTIKTYGVTGTSKVDWGTGTLTNKGAYVSDPAVNIFGTLVVEDEGYLTGGADDAFQIRGNFTSTSHSARWDVGRSALSFLGVGVHTYSSAGNASWGRLQLDPGAKLALKSLGSGPVSFSFATLAGFSSLADLQDRFSADSGITIQVASIEGGWAGTGSVSLPGGGVLISTVPEPASWVLMLLGVVGLLAGRRRPA